MAKNEGLIYACIFDGEGGGREIGWEEVRGWRPEQGTLWVHLNHSAPGARRWFNDHSGVGPVYRKAMLAPETRPRAMRAGEALLLTLRGVTPDPETDPEEMASVRVWLEPGRILTLRRRYLTAVNDIREALGRGEGPHGTGEFLVHLADHLVHRMAPTLEGLEDELDDLEYELLNLGDDEVPARLSATRRIAITLRRYLTPQREVFSQIQGIGLGWLDDNQRLRLGEIADRTARYIEDLNLARERAAVIQDEATNRVSQRMNRSIFALTRVATVMLPLSLITGLLGVNVAGIPWADKGWAFAAVLAALGAMAGAVIWVLRKSKL